MAYYYTHNSRGDIVGIYNGDGVLRAKYEYDAWGNVLSITDKNGNAITSETHIGNLNPFRYRGYYYDTESGFYYLMSRYYDPVTHRFINADGYFQAGNGILDANTFAYCGNNPVNYSDPNGEHSSSVTCGDPTCTQCRPERRKFINEHVDWYNKVTNSNILGVAKNGMFVYSQNNSSNNYYVNYNTPYVTVVDSRNNTNNPNIKIINSCAITEYSDKLAIIEFLQSYNIENPSYPTQWNRTTESLINEWDAHNFAYNCLPFTQSHTQDVDLDNNDKLANFLGFIDLYTLFQ